jgi:integrase
MNIITPAEIDRLASAINPRYRAFPIVACYTELRVSERFGLKWRNVHFAESYVEVSTTTIETDGAVLLGQPTKSEAGRRTVPLSAKAKMALLAHREMYGGGPDDYVFQSRTAGESRAALTCFPADAMTFSPQASHRRRASLTSSRQWRERLRPSYSVAGSRETSFTRVRRSQLSKGSLSLTTGPSPHCHQTTSGAVLSHPKYGLDG